MIAVDRQQTNQALFDFLLVFERGFINPLGKLSQRAEEGSSQMPEKLPHGSRIGLGDSHIAEALRNLGMEQATNIFRGGHSSPTFEATASK